MSTTVTTQWAVAYRWFEPDWEGDVRLHTGKWHEECDMLEASNATRTQAIHIMMEYVRKINHPMYRGPISDARLVSRKLTAEVTVTEWKIVRTTGNERAFAAVHG